MRADEIREMSIDDIQTRVKELEEEQFRLKFRSATEPLEDPLRLRVTSPRPGAPQDRVARNSGHRPMAEMTNTNDAPDPGHAQDARGSRGERQDAEDGRGGRSSAACRTRCTGRW